MSVHHASAAVTAAAATALILTARWAATRHRHRHLHRDQASTARLSWRRTTPLPDEPQTAPTPGPAAQDAQASVAEAEQHVYRYWRKLRTNPEHRDT
ncbi:hypothetical protein [Streptomyces chromofuscus]|uniref:hypothetical protein n=1 Tax=Streptomyces chromofuscus TaxID=42881 RepID=UPI0016773C87|nr:hypothetical protein [Streptomyces chromofuscus]GGT04399.1 hypothetical protein GCM10010254_26050 [Streptomyces chromofuscus]